MLRRLIKITIVLSIILSASWFVFRRGEIKSFEDAWSQLQKDGSQLFSSIQNVSFRSGSHSTSGTLTIASFDLDDFQHGKLQSGRTAEVLVEILSRYDVIALQGIRSPDHGTLLKLMDCLKQKSPSYDYVIGPRSSHTAVHHQFAFVFNRETVELNRKDVYTVQDPDDVLAHDPLVGWFRVRGNEKSAFTFSLVNLRIDESNKLAELGYLQKIKLAVKGDGHQEDDVLLLGNFQENSLAMLNRNLLPGCDFAIRQETTDLAAERQVSNLAFPKQSTTEFTGRTGVQDFLTESNLGIEEARAVSPHLPIWAEFFTEEGKASGYAIGISQ